MYVGLARYDPRYWIALVVIAVPPFVWYRSEEWTKKTLPRILMTALSFCVALFLWIWVSFLE